MKNETVHDTEHEIHGETRFNTDAHPEIQGCTFAEIYKTKADFVKFTKSWTKATGVYNLWFKYVKQQNE